MEIVWYGHACFRLRGRGCAVVCDPYSPDLGVRLPRLTANIVTISIDRPEHNYAAAIRSGAYVAAGPGEYEIAGTYVIGVDTGEGRREAPRSEPLPTANTAYIIEMEGLTVCHLGCLAAVPDQTEIEQYSGVDILMVPAGGGSALGGTQAAEVVNLIEPRIVIPMSYRIPDLAGAPSTEARFLRDLAIEKPKAMESLTISASQLPEETTVILLSPRREAPRPAPR